MKLQSLGWKHIYDRRISFVQAFKPRMTGNPRQEHAWSCSLGRRVVSTDKIRPGWYPVEVRNKAMFAVPSARMFDRQGRLPFRNVPVLVIVVLMDCEVSGDVKENFCLEACVITVSYTASRRPYRHRSLQQPHREPCIICHARRAVTIDSPPSLTAV